jgi:hypothetical protein
MNHSIQPIDVRNSWHWNLLKFAGRTKYLLPRHRQLDNPVTSCNYVRAVLFAMAKVVLCLFLTLFLSYFVTLTIILNVIYQWNITGDFHHVMEIMLLDLSEPYGTIVVLITTALFVGVSLCVSLGLIFSAIATSNFISVRNRQRRHSIWKAEGRTGLPAEPAYKNSSTYKLYKSFSDKYCVPIRTE